MSTITVPKTPNVQPTEQISDQGNDPRVVGGPHRSSTGYGEGSMFPGHRGPAGEYEQYSANSFADLAARVTELEKRAGIAYKPSTPASPAFHRPMATGTVIPATQTTPATAYTDAKQTKAEKAEIRAQDAKDAKDARDAKDNTWTLANAKR